MSIETELTLVEISLVLVCLALLFHVAAWRLHEWRKADESGAIWRAKPKQRGYECPRCGYVITEDRGEKTPQKYCGNCGLRLMKCGGDA